MIIGLLLVGSLLGILGAVGALISGQTFLIAVLVYFSTAIVCVIGIPLACAFRPRGRRLDEVGRNQAAALRDL